MSSLTCPKLTEIKPVTNKIWIYYIYIWASCSLCTRLNFPIWLTFPLKARTSSSMMYSYGPPHMAKQKQDDQLKHTYSSYVMIRDVAQKTCQRRWMIGRSGARMSGISVLAAKHDGDDEQITEKLVALPTMSFKTINHYSNCATELKNPWNLKVMVILIVIVGLITISKGLVKRLEDLGIRW